jgi:hypothetical protein
VSAQSAQGTQPPVGEQQTTFSEYVDTVKQCAASFEVGTTVVVNQCLEALDSIIPQSCYAISWATYRTLVFLAITSVSDDLSVLNPAIQFLIATFTNTAPDVTKACTPYTVGENEN